MQKKIYCVVSFLLMLTFALVGCGASSANLAMEKSESYDAMPMEEMEYAPEAGISSDYAMETPREGGDVVYDESASYADVTVERIVLKNANLTIEVGDPAMVVNTITLMAEKRGGFVVSSNIYQSYYYQAQKELPQGYIMIRVPAEQLNSTLDEIRSLTEDPQFDVTAESVSGQDVTSEYTDLSSRLRNLEEAEAQMRIFMEGAENTEEVLMVYNQQKQIAEEIEIIKGQLKYYDEASSLSSISIEVLPKYDAIEVTSGGWKLEGVFKQALQTLVDAFQFIVEALVWIVIVVLPVLIMISIPLVIVILVIRAIVKRSKKRKAKKVESSKE